MQAFWSVNVKGDFRAHPSAAPLKLTSHEYVYHARVRRISALTRARPR